MKKRFVYWILIASMVMLVFAGCNNKTVQDAAGGAITNDPVVPDTVQDSGTTDTPVEAISLKIGWAPPNMTGVFKTATDYMQAACDQAKEFGLDITLVSKPAESEADTAGQVKNIENLVQEGCDAIIVSPSSVEACVPAMAAAKAEGVRTIMVNMLEEQDPEGVAVDAYIGFDNFVAGQISAYNVLDQLGGPGVLGEGDAIDVPVETYMDLAFWQDLYKDVDKASITGKVGVIEGVLGTMYSNQRKGGFQDITDQYPNVEIVNILPGNWERTPSVAAAENIIQAFPDVEIIWAAATEMAMGATIARDNMDRKDILVFSNDGTPESIQAINDGVIIAETWHGFPEWGWYGVQAGVQLVTGFESDVERYIDILPRTEYKKNADQFYPEPKLKAIDWKALYEGAAANQ